MLNKKRLAMMAVAASMVLPTNLTYLSMATPVTVFAAATDFPTNSTADVIELSDEEYSLSGNVELDKPLVVPTGKNVTLDLGSNTLTLTLVSKKDASGNVEVDPQNGKIVYYSPLKVQGQLTIKGTGTITYVIPQDAKEKPNLDKPVERRVMINVAEGGNLTVEKGVTLDASYTSDKTADNKDKKFGNAIGITDKNTTVTINGATVQGGSNGIWISGELKKGEDGNGPKVYVNQGSKIFGGETGIYQAGYAVEVTVDNAEVKGDSDCGIEVRGGNLTVQGGSKVTGDMTPEATSVLKVYGNTSGAAVENAGIAVAQHITNQNIKVEVTGENTVISGAVALAVLDPLGNQSDKATDLKGELDKETFDISVTDAQLKGAEYNVVYHDNTIPFTLKDVQFDSSAKADVQKLDLTPNKGNNVCAITVATQDPALNTVPYTIITPINSEDSTAVLVDSTKLTSVAKNDKEDPTKQVVQIKLGEDDEADTLDLPLEALNDGLTLKTLSDALTELKEGDGVEDPKNPEEKITPNYTYTIAGLKSVGVSKDGIVLVGEEDETPALAVELKANSNIKLTTGDSAEGEEPAGNEDPQAAPLTDVVEVMETEGDEIDGGEETPVTESVTEYVKLEDLANDSNVADEEAINDYLATNHNGYKVVNSSLPNTGLTTTTALTITGETPDVKLDENGFIEVKITKDTGEQKPDDDKKPVYTGGNKKPKPKPEEPAEPTTPATPTTMYRLYNRLTGEHLFTTDKNERDNLLTSDTWKDEGEGWTAPSVSDYPVYRLLNPNTSDHHYTTDKNEFDTLPSYGWVAEGVAFFSADKDNPENVILHRLYNPNAKGAGMHHYTADTNERDMLVAQGWKYEGTAWAGLKN